MSFIAELKRRNVFRAVVAYSALAWLLTEAAGTLFPVFGIPDWGIRFLVIVFALGFVPILVFSWAYELTPEGVKREKDVVRDESITPMTARRLDLITISLFLMAGAIVLVDRLWLNSPDSDVPAISEAPPVPVPGAESPSNAIAVLPFKDKSPDNDQEHFSDGLSDTLIHVLAQVSGLKVTAMTSSFYFKGKNIDVRDIARKLEVGTILEGSVQKSGNRVRVIAQLVNTRDGTHLWSKSFDRDLEDIFAIQDEIARDVVGALKVTLLDAEEKQLTQRYQPTLEAYGELILGRQQLAKRTAKALTAAERHFKKAIELDPGYALAYFALSRTYSLQQSYSGLLKEESMERRQPLIEKALELDPVSGEAYVAKAFVYLNRGEFEAAEDHFLKAIELYPNNAEAHHWYYRSVLRSQGRSDEGLAQMRLAAELDPMSPVIQSSLALSAWEVGHAKEATDLIRRNVELTPEFPENYHVMFVFQSRMGQIGEAQRWIGETRKKNPEGPHHWFDECLGFLNLGDTLAAENCANQLSNVHPEHLDTSGVWHALHLYQGKWDAAISNRESMLERSPGNPRLTWHLADTVARQGGIDRARRLMADAYPNYLEEGVEPELIDPGAALTFAAILQANGELMQRDVLLVALENKIATMNRASSVRYGNLAVSVHAMRGDRVGAIQALRDAIDVGWRGAGVPILLTWWSFRQDWKLASIRQDPAFSALLTELEGEIDKQRLDYEVNKDKPLL